MSMWRGEAMDEDKFTAVMLALGYEQHIIEAFAVLHGEKGGAG